MFEEKYIDFDLDFFQIPTRKRLKKWEILVSFFKVFLIFKVFLNLFSLGREKSAAQLKSERPLQQADKPTLW